MRLLPVNTGCGGSKTHEMPVSIGLWRVYCHVAASVAGPTSKIPNVYAVCGAVAGPGGGNVGRENVGASERGAFDVRKDQSPENKSTPKSEGRNPKHEQVHQGRCAPRTRLSGNFVSFSAGFDFFDYELFA
jgi:hypothetical protein